MWRDDVWSTVGELHAGSPAGLVDESGRRAAVGGLRPRVWDILFHFHQQFEVGIVRVTRNPGVPAYRDAQIAVVSTLQHEHAIDEHGLQTAGFVVGRGPARTLGGAASEGRQLPAPEFRILLEFVGKPVAPGALILDPLEYGKRRDKIIGA